ncbi:UPF0223 family protein [Macrococcoides caseolyticum]|uniref:UPF0223 family protein n=1 Tax=Macrococcoides caseolyticum TaxID=69966 RepID=UPI001F4683BB|nr:UPF0223 family protein [Macrococcus caseolyticus]MCE4956916.1 UPF0223 family protein [Macrococcus caseolyticus]
MSYSYPIDPDWSQEEIIDVVNFLALVEDAYESKVNTDDFGAVYKAFKKVAPMKSDENKIYKDFKNASTYDGYLVTKRFKAAVEAGEKTFKM